ncbi:hypothetical protein [Lacinutrix sp.]|uniref:hypothetical protein n=1 Tax=Lacinutrix sp. TaxID=1937692 RepID=UPI0025BF0B8C|nr:hypothetical protein [Lacinutrix sp.]
MKPKKLAKDKARLTREFSGKFTADFYYEQFTNQTNRMVKNLREPKKRLISKKITRNGSSITRISTDGLLDTLLDNYNNHMA